MARVSDNIEQDLLGALRGTMTVSQRADFRVGYLTCGAGGLGHVGGSSAHHVYPVYTSTFEETIPC